MIKQTTKGLLKTKSDLHLQRKLWHFLTVLLMAFLYDYLGRERALIVLLCFMIVFIPLDILRLRFDAINEIIIKLFRTVMRRSEINTLAGTTYLLTGVFIIAYLFKKDIVMLTLLFLAAADPMASYIGVRYGKDSIGKNKSLQGTIAAFLCCTIVALGFYLYNEIMIERVILVSVLSGIIGAFSEFFPIGKLDDNLTLPIISSLLLWILFGIFS